MRTRSSLLAVLGIHNGPGVLFVKVSRELTVGCRVDHDEKLAKRLLLHPIGHEPIQFGHNRLELHLERAPGLLHAV